MKHYKTIELEFSKGEIVEYILDSVKHKGVIVGWKFTEHPYLSKIQYGIMSPGDYNETTPYPKKIDWISSENIEANKMINKRPFANRKECFSEMLKHLPNGWISDSDCYYNITVIDDDGIIVSDYEDKVLYYPFETAVDVFKFVDGKCFGYSLIDNKE